MNGGGKEDGDCNDSPMMPDAEGSMMGAENTTAAADGDAPAVAEPDNIAGAETIMDGEEEYCGEQTQDVGAQTYSEGNLGSEDAGKDDSCVVDNVSERNDNDDVEEGTNNAIPQDKVQTPPSCDESSPPDLIDSNGFPAPALIMATDESSSDPAPAFIESTNDGTSRCHFGHLLSFSSYFSSLGNELMLVYMNT